MLIDFFMRLKVASIPVTPREFLTLLEAMQKRVLPYASLDEYYALSRLCLVKSETHYDKFDRVFAEYFRGTVFDPEKIIKEIPEQWLRQLAEKILTEEEMRSIEATGDLEKLMEMLKKRLEEQQERHQGGSKWVGTAGTSPFGAFGYNPEGVRIGQNESRHQRAVKVWDKREFKDLDDSVELGTRNIKMALRRLRHFAREGAAEELDLPDTIRSTAKNAGYLDLRMVPKRHNKVKVLLFFDVGGSMDPHISVCEKLFSAARTEFKHLEFFYFHNFIYESVWRTNSRRREQRFPTLDLIHTFGSDYKLIFVGDANMAPYEIESSGGSLEHHNRESGATWLQRLLDHFTHSVWLNPVPEDYWRYTTSVQMIRQLMETRMFPLTMEGLIRSIRVLSK